MWNKIYALALVFFSAILAFMQYYAFSWLQSIGNPLDALAGYFNVSGVATIFLTISTLILLIFGNAVLWSRRTAWALWTALIYFAVFKLIDVFLIERSAVHFAEANNITGMKWTTAPFVAVFYCVAAAAIVYADLLLVNRMLQRLEPQTALTPEETDPADLDVGR